MQRARRRRGGGHEHRSRSAGNRQGGRPRIQERPRADARKRRRRSAGRRRARRRHRVRRRRCRHRGVRRRRDQGHRPRRQVLVPGLHGRPPARPTALLRRTVPNRHPRRHHGQRGVSAHHPRVRGSASRRRSVLRRTVHAERLSATRRIEPGPAERGPRRHLLRQAHHDPRRIAPFLLGEQQGAGNRRNHGRHARPRRRLHRAQRRWPAKRSADRRSERPCHVQDRSSLLDREHGESLRSVPGVLSFAGHHRPHEHQPVGHRAHPRRGAPQHGRTGRSASAPALPRGDSRAWATKASRRSSMP